MQNKRNTCTLEFEPEMRCTHKMLGLFSADCSFSPPFPPPPLVCSFFDSSREWECEWAAQNGGNVKPLCTLGGRNKNSNTRNSTSSTLLHPNTSLLLLCLVQNRCFRFVFLPLLRFLLPLKVATTTTHPIHSGTRSSLAKRLGSNYEPKRTGPKSIVQPDASIRRIPTVVADARDARKMLASQLAGKLRIIRKIMLILDFFP